MINFFKHWDFIINPFESCAYNDYYFNSSSFDEAISRCQFSIDNNNSFLITGKSGCGKTFFLHKLINDNIISENKFFYIQAGNFGIFDLLSSVCSELQIEVSSWYKIDVVRAIQNKLQHYENELKSKCIIIIDDANLLSKKVLNELNLLNNFINNTSVKLNLFLSGSPALKSYLQTPELSWLRHKMLLNTTLEYLDCFETRDYIDYCFDNVGLDADGIILEDGMEAVYKYSAGNFRLINNIMTCCLIICAIENTHAITKDVVLKAKDETLI